MRQTFPFSSRFPARSIGRVLAHAERRCRKGCSFCRRERETQRDKTKLLEASINLLKERKNV